MGFYKMSSQIKNRVDDAGLMTFDVASLISPAKRQCLDLAMWLEGDLVIKEAFFRKKLQKFKWVDFLDCFVCVVCSKDAIIPPWAYLLVQTKLRNIARQVFFCSPKQMELLLFEQELRKLNLESYKNKRVFLKVCGDKEVPLGAISLCTHVLMPHVKSLFYGEPCSGIPLIKN